MQDDLPFLSIREAADLLRTRRLSPVELTRAVLDRIDRLNPRLNAYITVTHEWAMELARAAEREIMTGNYGGPLHGIPIGLKDLYDTAGVLTTAGSKVLGDNVPAEHATVVTKLLEAGAVIVGKQNMHEFASGFSNINPHFGTAQNPWKLGHISGGSSGGTANSVAAGLCLGGMGSDTAGSIRVPSAFCSLTGLKPTYGRVSLKGVIPLSWSLDHAGPMAHSAEDCALMLNVIAGYDPADDFSVNVPTEDYAAGAYRGLRVGIIQDFMEDTRLNSEVGTVVQRAIEVLHDQGAVLTEVRLPGLDEIRSAARTILFAESAAYHAPLIERRATGYAPELLERLSTRTTAPAVPLANAYRLHIAAIRSFGRLMKGYDAIVGPTVPFTAPRIEELPAGRDVPSVGIFTQIFNFTGLPALSVPCGFDNQGLPVGMMIVGGRWDERTVLRLGHAYQQATDWHHRRPPLE